MYALPCNPFFRFWFHLEFCFVFFVTVKRYRRDKSDTDAGAGDEDTMNNANAMRISTIADGTDDSSDEHFEVDTPVFSRTLYGREISKV